MCIRSLNSLFLFITGRKEDRRETPTYPGGPMPQRTIALNRHLAWLKQLQGDMQAARQEAAAEKAASAPRGREESVMNKV